MFLSLMTLCILINAQHFNVTPVVEVTQNKDMLKFRIFSSGFLLLNVYSHVKNKIHSFPNNI
jgi:hypothetical protein